MHANQRMKKKCNWNSFFFYDLVHTILLFDPHLECTAQNINFILHFYRCWFFHLCLPPFNLCICSSLLLSHCCVFSLLMWLFALLCSIFDASTWISKLLFCSVLLFGTKYFWVLGHGLIIPFQIILNWILLWACTTPSFGFFNLL